MKSLGIIGTGSFGVFLAQKLSSYLEVKTYGRNSKGDSTFSEVVACDFLTLAVPLSAYDEILESVKKDYKDSTVVVDVCSVKEKPIELIRKYLPDSKILATHPLFGPESAADSFDGHTIIVCPTESTPQDLYENSKMIFESVGLIVVERTLAEHDEMMADLQALTFFMARGLKEYGVEKKIVITPSYNRLLELAELENHHSQDLFETIQKGNRFAKTSRQKILGLLNEINSKL